MSEVQLKGNCHISTSSPQDAASGGGTDYSAYISSVVIKRTRASVTVPPTLANIRETQKAGALQEAVEINFFSSMAAASFWAELYDAIDTDSAELSFGANLVEGATGPDNPNFSGTFVVLGIDTGADVGSLREQSQTYPVTSAGITKAIS